MADFLLTFCRFDNSRVSIVNGYGFSKELLGNRNTAIQSYTIRLFHMTSAKSDGETINEVPMFHEPWKINTHCGSTPSRLTIDTQTNG